jgi:hypothetical protein
VRRLIARVFVPAGKLASLLRAGLLEGVDSRRSTVIAFCGAYFRKLGAGFSSRFPSPFFGEFGILRFTAAPASISDGHRLLIFHICGARNGHSQCLRICAWRRDNEHHRKLFRDLQAWNARRVPALRRKTFTPLSGGIRFPYNYRASLGYNDTDRTIAAVRGGEGKRLTYHQPR